jgi:hypothetical protein
LAVVLHECPVFLLDHSDEILVSPSPEPPSCIWAMRTMSMVTKPFRGTSLLSQWQKEQHKATGPPGEGVSHWFLQLRVSSTGQRPHSQQGGWCQVSQSILLIHKDELENWLLLFSWSSKGHIWIF